MHFSDHFQTSVCLPFAVWAEAEDGPIAYVDAQQLCQKAFPSVPACLQSVLLVFLVLSVCIFSDWNLLFASTSGNSKRSESVLTGLLDLSWFSNLLLMQPQKGNKPRPNRDLWQLVLVHGCLWSDERLWLAFRRRCQLLRPGSCGNAEHEVQNSHEKPWATKKQDLCCWSDLVAFLFLNWQWANFDLFSSELRCDVSPWAACPTCWHIQRRQRLSKRLQTLQYCLCEVSSRELVCRSQVPSHISFFLGLEEKPILSKKEKMKLRKERWLQSKYSSKAQLYGGTSHRVILGNPDVFFCRWGVGESVGLWQDEGWGSGSLNTSQKPSSASQNVG